WLDGARIGRFDRAEAGRRLQPALHLALPLAGTLRHDPQERRPRCPTGAGRAAEGLETTLRRARLRRGDDRVAYQHLGGTDMGRLVAAYQRAELWVIASVIVTLITLNSFLQRRRMSHWHGVGARGSLRI